MFPEELPYRIIRMFSFIGDRVLDPFVGSGTTLKVAKSLFRKGIGYELNDSFKPTIKNKIKNAKKGLFRDFQYLLYKLYQKGVNEDVKFNFEKQKQKSIIILTNNNNSEIILDYMLFEDDIKGSENIKREFKSKFEENSIQNYLKEKEGWESPKNYIIAVNSHESQKGQIMNIGNNQLIKIKPSKKLQLIHLNDLISKELEISQLFE